MTQRTNPPADPATVRTQIYSRAVHVAAAELRAAGANPVEIATGALTAALEMLADASDRDQVRRMLHRLADSMI